MLAKLIKDENGIRSGVLPDGKVAVYAPPSFQAGIEPLLKSVNSKNDSNATIDFKVWQVIGTRAAKTAVEPALEVMHTELEEVAKIYGPMELSLYLASELQTVAGDSGLMRNGLGRIEAEGNLQADRIYPRLKFVSNFKPSPIDFETTVQLSPGKTVVFGQNLAEPNRTLFYVINASLVR